MKIGRPSPSMVVSVIALVFAMTGTGVAAVSFARNAGAVDGKSAVSAGSSLFAARGKLVATESGRGGNAGRIPAKFLADTAVTAQFGRNEAVPDNSMTGAIELANQEDTGGLGRITMTCADQANGAGVLDPQSKITWTDANPSKGFVNAAYRAGTGAATIRAIAPGTAIELTINGSNTFEFHMQYLGKTVLVQGVVRQDGRNTASAQCLAYGIVTVAR